MLITFPALIPNRFFRNSFSIPTFIEWNNLEINIRKLESYGTFKTSILRSIRPTENLVFSFHNPNGIKLITRLRLDFSHLRKHRFIHNFQNTLNPICSCRKKNWNYYYLFQWPNQLNERMTLLNNIQKIEEKVLRT